MADEQVNTPSQADAQASDAAAQEQGSDGSQEGSSPGWWQRLFNRRSSEETTTADGDQATDGAGASKALVLSQEELDRKIQAETDRREAKRAQEARQQQRKQLRDTDPWAYAQQDREAEQTEEQGGAVQKFFSDIGAHHDRAAIDPIVEALPKAERDRIMKLDGAGVGLDGRKLVVTESLKALEKHWRAEGEKSAERRLRSNSAYRKQLYSEFRGSSPEPDLLPATSASEADQTVTDILRRHYNMPSPNGR